jgi:hypothetical protein
MAEGRPTRTLREVLNRLRETYCSSIGYEVHQCISAVFPCIGRLQELNDTRASLWHRCRTVLGRKAAVILIGRSTWTGRATQARQTNAHVFKLPLAL